MKEFLSSQFNSTFIHVSPFSTSRILGIWTDLHRPHWPWWDCCSTQPLGGPPEDSSTWTWESCCLSMMGGVFLDGCKNHGGCFCRPPVVPCLGMTLQQTASRHFIITVILKYRSLGPNLLQQQQNKQKTTPPTPTPHWPSAPPSKFYIDYYNYLNENYCIIIYMKI